MKEVTNNQVWEKAKSFIAEKYGKSINFKSFNLSLKSDLFFVEGEDLVIPLNRNKASLGEVIVTNGQFLSQEQKIEVADFVKFLIEPHVYNQYLVIKEQQTHAQIEQEELKLKESTYSTNIYNLFNSHDDDTAEIVTTSSNKLISNIIHLKSISEQTRRKVAFKIHEMVENQLFISFTDLSLSLKTVNDFINLGKTTIFVDNIDLLNEAQLNLIQEASENQKSEVVFIFGSNKTDAEISSLNIHFSLINKLNAFVFEIDRIPLNQQMSTDILELLFFNLDQSADT